MRKCFLKACPKDNVRKCAMHSSWMQLTFQHTFSFLSTLYSGGLWFLFIVEVSPSGWGWTIGLSTFPG